MGAVIENVEVDRGTGERRNWLGVRFDNGLFNGFGRFNQAFGQFVGDGEGEMGFDNGNSGTGGKAVDTELFFGDFGDFLFLFGLGFKLG